MEAQICRPPRRAAVTPRRCAAVTVRCGRGQGRCCCGAGQTWQPILADARGLPERQAAAAAGGIGRAVPPARPPCRPGTTAWLLPTWRAPSCWLSRAGAAGRAAGRGQSAEADLRGAGLQGSICSLLHLPASCILGVWRAVSDCCWLGARAAGPCCPPRTRPRAGAAIRAFVEVLHAPGLHTGHHWR